jgi:hypothetical protein
MRRIGLKDKKFGKDWSTEKSKQVEAIENSGRGRKAHSGEEQKKSV